MSDATVGIVGAGITGLALTHHLAERGVDSVAFEAEAEAGGVIRSVERDGRVLEVGPQRIRKTPGVAALVESAGLVDDLIEAEESLPLYVYADGRLREAPFDRSTFLRTDLLSWPGKLRFLAEPLTSAGDPDETAGALFERKFGTEGYRNFVGPLYGGIYGSDPAHMPARYALAGLLEREAEAGSLLTAFRQRVGGGRSFPPISFDDGMQSLPRALADAHADRVRLDTPVTAIREEGGAGTASADGRYVVETPDDAVTVDHVVVTTRGDVAAELLAPLAPSAQALRDLRYNPLAIVHLQADSDREGFGYQVGLDEDLHTLGASWNASMFGRDGVYTLFLGGMHEPDLVAEDDATLGEIATREFESVMGDEAEVLNVRRLDQGFPAYDESWAALDDLSLPDGLHLATNYTARMGVPSRVREAEDLAASLAD